MPNEKHAFSASAAKIRRARQHLAELESEIAAYLARTPAKCSAVVESPTFIRFGLDIEGVPESVGAIVGDLIHNLRTALDLAACEIVRAAGQSDDDVYFPSCKGADELDNMIRRRNFDRAGSAAVDLLRSLKPYRNGNAALRLIHDLDIHDKHRALIPQVLTAASPVIRMWDDDGTFNPTVIGDPSAASEVKVVFPNLPGERDGQAAEIIPTAHKLVQLVDGIVDAFRAIANEGG